MDFAFGNGEQGMISKTKCGRTTEPEPVVSFLVLLQNSGNFESAILELSVRLMLKRRRRV